MRNGSPPLAIAGGFVLIVGVLAYVSFSPPPPKFSQASDVSSQVVFETDAPREPAQRGEASSKPRTTTETSAPAPFEPRILGERRAGPSDTTEEVVPPATTKSIPTKPRSITPPSNEQLERIAFPVIDDGPTAQGRSPSVRKLDRRPARKLRVENIDAPQPRKVPPTVEPGESVMHGFENRVLSVVSQPPRQTGEQMVETKSDPLSTFAVDVDTGAYTLARARLRKGYLPKPEEVRLEEFLNYFVYDYPLPADGVFAAHLEAAPNPFAVGVKQHILRVGIQARDVAADQRPPAHLTFVIDVSGSMFGADKLELAREALELVTRNLRPDDTVAIVTYARGAEVELWPAGASERDLVLAAIARLEAGGSSALDEGLGLAYRVASTHFRAGHINRVVLMSDGRANVGESSPSVILAGVRGALEDGVTLSTIGFGEKSFNDRMMEQLADNGNGNYFFVDSYREATRVFGHRLCGTLHVVASEVKIQVEFDPDAVARHKLLGYDNRRLAHSQFRDASVDAGEVGAGHSVTALYLVDLADKPSGELATVRVRYRPHGQTEVKEDEYTLMTDGLGQDVRQASADFKFAAAVSLFARALASSARPDASRLSFLREIASEGVTRPDEQGDRVELLELIEQAIPYFE